MSFDSDSLVRRSNKPMLAENAGKSNVGNLTDFHQYKNSCTVTGV